MIKNGTIFAGRYEIIERIGSGGMADVYKAHDERLKRDVAIKVLKASLAEDQSFVEKFRTEGEAAASLTNANVVSVYDVGNVGSIYYIVMELIDGITLKDYIRRKGMLSSRETMAISAQVAVGLRAAHARHIVHRDIKPQNIILSRDGKVKVTDFGIARAVTDETRHGQKTELGSVHYIAPEQAKGQSCDERSDIYSLGIVMYEMITGRVPFDKDTSVAVALAHMNETMMPPSEINPDCPVALEQIIFRCTQKSRERRYHNCTELLQDLKIAVNNPSFNFEKQQQENTLKSTTQVYTGMQAGGAAAETAFFQPNVPATQEQVDFGYDDAEEVDEENAGPRQAVTIVDSEAVENNTRPGIRERRTAGPMVDFTELSPDRASDGDGAYDDELDDKNDLFSEDSKEDEKTLMDRIVMISGIVIGAVIICLLIYIFATLSGCTQRSKKPTTEAPETTETVTSSQYTFESETTLATKASDDFDPETDSIVPTVLGMSYQDAAKALQDAGLQCKVGTEVGYSDIFPVGSVMLQSYPEGTILAKGSTIVVMLSAGSDKFEIKESYIGAALQTFRQDALNFKEITFEYERVYSDTVPANHIISITPASGFVENGSTVHVVYSAGKEYVPVPDLYGSAYSEAATKLLYSALSLGSVSREYNKDVPEGLIFGQSPAPGTVVKNGSSVNIVVSLGAEKAEVPNVVGMDVEEAIKALTDAGFVTEIVESYDPDGTDGEVLSTDPEGGEYLEVGGTVTLTVCLADITMPDLVGSSLDDATKRASEVGFVIGKTTMKTTNDANLNNIVESQSIAAGTSIKPDSETKVDLVIWTYEELPIVPDVVNAGKDEAEKALKEAGYKVSITTENTDVPDLNNTVKSMTPAGGSGLKTGETVSLVVYTYVSSETQPSSETSSDQVAVPNVVGYHYSLNGIEKQLTDAGFAVNLVKVKNDISNDKTEIVISTDPAAGAMAAKGTTVTVTVYDVYTEPTTPSSESAAP